MKCLHITNTPQGLSLAKALAGSPAIAHGFSTIFIGIFKTYDFVCADNDIVFKRYSSIKIPLDSINLCPFVAMREKLFVKTKIWDGKRTNIHTGKIMWLEGLGFAVGDSNCTPYSDCELDIDYYATAGIDGITVEEE